MKNYTFNSITNCTKFFFIAFLGLGLILISCNKDKKEEEPLNLDYFYTRERNTIFFEDFTTNLNNWSLYIDSTYRDTVWPDTSLASYAVINNGQLDLFACNRDNSYAKMDISNLNIWANKYICVEIYFSNYRTHDDMYVFGWPNGLKLGFGNYSIIEHGKQNATSLSKINILYDTEKSITLTALSNQKAIEDNYFYLNENNSFKKEISFSAYTYYQDMIGRVTGNTIVNSIEIYTIEQ